jgi:hypothetical protein
LALRCAILDQAGYTSVSATFVEAETLLNSKKFDIVIVSARLTQDEKRRVESLAQDTPFLFLNGVTFPRDLLKIVSDLIASPAAGMSTPGPEPRKA